MRSHLSPLDATFLEIEQTDPAAHMHVGWAMVFDPPPSGKRPSLEQLRRQVRSRLEGFSVLRRRLSLPRVDDMSLPVWLPDPDFDVGLLIRRATLAAPGGEAELMDWLGGYFSRRLDRALPLWEITLLEGLEGGRWALVWKVHHCLVDGLSAGNVAAALLDAQPEPEEGVTILSDMLASFGEESERGVLTRLRGVVGAGVGGGTDAEVKPHEVPTILAQSRTIAASFAADEPDLAPATSLNEGTGAKRRLAAVDVALEELKKVRAEHGGTVNDVVMTATAGGLRRLFADRHEAVDRLRAVVLTPLERSTQMLAGGNPSSLFVDMEVGEEDTLARYRKMVAASSERKSIGVIPGADTVTGVAGLSPALVQSVIARLAFTPRLFNLTVANVPAFPFPLYSLGAEMRRIVPAVPLFSGQSLGVAAVGYNGGVYFGLNADPEAVPDLDLVRSGIEQTLHDLARVTA
ncbi:MAG TPA: wax ester/triacylglycerol synthase family O-acyltransferase [Solirubrobacterales bacterium]|nr:wax ester/triacylglycerol synthase family O-acyltransferase [Solirubrobacterales bacterium]